MKAIKKVLVWDFINCFSSNTVVKIINIDTNKVLYNDDLFNFDLGLDNNFGYKYYVINVEIIDNQLAIKVRDRDYNMFGELDLSDYSCILK